MSLEVLYNLEKGHIKRREDAAVCCIHCYMTANGFKCVGKGEEIPSGNVHKSDMLPAGWNDNDGVYALMYQRVDAHDSSIYLLKIIEVDGMLLVHLLKTSDAKLVDMEIKVDDFIGKDLSSYESTYVNIGELDQRFKSTILAPFLPDTSRGQAAGRSADTDRRPFRDSDDPLRVPSHRPPPVGADWNPRRDHPFSIGHDDLTPFGSGVGGGMVFDPMRTGGPGLGRGGSGCNDRYNDPYGFPRGAIVPGARFDPIRPPGVDPSGGFRPQGPGSQRPGPDPDHLPPPGYDDMYM